MIILHSRDQGLRYVVRVAQHGALSWSVALPSPPRLESRRSDRQLRNEHTLTKFRRGGLGFPSSSKDGEGGPGEKVFTPFSARHDVVNKHEASQRSPPCAFPSNVPPTKVDICDVDEGNRDRGVRQDGEGKHRESKSEARPVVLFASRRALRHGAGVHRSLLSDKGRAVERVDLRKNAFCYFAPVLVRQLPTSRDRPHSLRPLSTQRERSFQRLSRHRIPVEP